MKFIFKPISNPRQIGKKRPYSDIKFIVIHYTGNYSKGADAMAHFKYLQGAKRYGSAHYYADDKEIIQVIGDSFVAWSVGDNQGYGRYLNGCTNSNSISIEMCVNADSDQDKVYKNTLELTKNLMEKFKVPASKVVRHYDVSRKDCPHNFRNNNWAKWWQFKKDIEKPIEWKIDLSKNSEFGKEKDMEKDYKNHWAEKEIDEVKEAGIMKGYEDRNFKPDEKITRAEVAVIVAKLLKKN